MANEALSGALQGIASGLTQVTGQRLQAEGLNIRSQRTAALNRGLDIREDEFELAEQLRKDSLPREQAEFEHEQAMRQQALKIEKARADEAEQEQAEKGELKLPLEFMEERMDLTPEQEKVFASMTSTFMGEFLDGNGMMSRFGWKQFNELVRKGEMQGYLESKKRMHSVGMAQIKNKTEAFQIENQKAEEKDPVLKTNSEHRKLNKKVAEADAAIAELDKSLNANALSSREIEEFEQELEVKKQEEAERQRLNQERIRQIDTILKAREGVDGGRNLKITKDEVGNVIAIDEDTLERIPISGAAGSVTGQPEVTSKSEFITAQELGKSTGQLSNIKAATARLFGFLKPGEQFSETVSARAKVRNVNKKIVQTLVLSQRFPVFEQQQIQGFLVDPGTFFADPASASGKMLDFKDFVIREKQLLEHQLNQTISADQRKENLGKIGNISTVLNLLPGDLGLKAVSRREITIEDMNNATIQEIKNLPKELLSLFPKEIKIEMINRLEGQQSSSVSGSF